MSAIFKRDLRSYFTTPVGYVYMAIFLAVNGGAFSMFTIQEGSDSKVASYFTTMIFALIGKTWSWRGSSYRSSL